MRQAGLPTLIAAGDNIYLPLFPSFKFLNNMIRQEGIDEAPLRALGHFEITELDEHFLARVSCAPTLKFALESFRNMVPIEDPNTAFGISYGETAVKLCMTNRVPLNAHNQYFEDWNELLVMVAIVRAFAEPAWQPPEMAFRSTIMPGRYAEEQFPNTRFLSGQKVASITVPHELLNSPLRVALDVYRPQVGQVAPPPYTTDFQTNVGNSLKSVLSPYLPERIPGIELAAKMAATSVRTLQRRLKESHLSYSDLVSELRFETAAWLLRKTDATTLEIALEVGYEDPSHFSRAFKRMAGINPREYRHQPRLYQTGPDQQ